MPASRTRLSPTSRRNVIALAVGVVVLFVVANLTAHSSGHPGTVSNVAFIACLFGVLLLILAGIVGLAGSRRRRTR